MFENIGNFFKKMMKNDQKELLVDTTSKDAAKERLHIVLMQDRANVSADFLELMKQEIIDVIKKYIVIDEEQIDVRLTNQENEDGTTGAPSLYANIPILNIRNDIKGEILNQGTNDISQEPENNVEIKFADSKDIETSEDISDSIAQAIREANNDEMLLNETDNKDNEKSDDENVEELTLDDIENMEDAKIDNFDDEEDDDDITFDDLLKAAEEEEKLELEKKSEVKEEKKDENVDNSKDEVITDKETEEKTSKSKTKSTTTKKSSTTKKTGSGNKKTSSKSKSKRK